MVSKLLHSTWAQTAIILVIGLLIFLPRLDSLPFRGEEPRRVISAFEIKQSGQWVVPTIQNQVFLSRPPLQNWVIAATASVRQNFDHLSGRLPSVFFAILTAWMIYFYCRSRLSKSTALMASLFFLTMPQVIQLGLTAETELMFTFLLSGSFLIWHKGELEGWPDFLKWGVAYGFLGLATLTKGINQAPVYFVLIVGIHLLIKRHVKSLFTLGHLFGFFVFTLIVGSWQWFFVEAVGFQTGWMMHFGDVGLRFEAFKTSDYISHAMIFPFELMAMMLPWSIYVFPYLSQTFRKDLLSKDMKSMAVFSSAAILITLWTVWYPAGARARYYMPLYPCFAILAAIALSAIQQTMSDSPQYKKHWSLRIPVVLRQVGMFGIPVIGLLFLASYFFSSQTLTLTSTPSHALIFVLGSFCVGYMLYRSYDIHQSSELLKTTLAYSLFAILFVNYVYTDSRLEQLNQIRQRVHKLVINIPKHQQLVSVGGADFDFLYYYMLEMNKTIDIVTPESLLNKPSGTLFCLRSSALDSLHSKDWTLIDEIPTGRYRHKRQHDGTYMIVGQLK